ncbi:MAG: Coenzyme F420 hydrogenase/dehydrogenase, beta subunit C-terminal domain [Lachnospiraceae bacterium]
MENNIVSELCFECENCINDCPTNAIRLEGQNIFARKAVVAQENCIHCGICEKVCPALNLNHLQRKETIAAYGVKSTDENARQSASGGLFFEMAKKILSENSYVAGAAYQDDWSVTTEIISDRKDLPRLQGSKYVKSYNRDAFSEIKRRIQSGQKVLFGGTPCQIAALYAYLDKPLRDSNQLITADLVCHGCPPGQMFQNYIDSLERKKATIITSFQFRSQKYGGKLVGRIGLNRNGKQRWEDLFSKESSYFSLFLDGYTYLESCYQCPFACQERISDFTISDYWGWKMESYRALIEKGVKEGDNVSAILIHTEKGRVFFDEIKDNMIAVQVKPECIIKHNPQLNRSSHVNQVEREKLIDGYIRDGYNAIEKFFKAKYGLKRYTMRLSCIIPISVKKFLKKYLLHI